MIVDRRPCRFTGTTKHDSGCGGSGNHCTSGNSWVHDFGSHAAGIQIFYYRAIHCPVSNPLKKELAEFVRRWPEFKDFLGRRRPMTWSERSFAISSVKRGSL
jgi:hypothetical protein